MSFSEDNGDIKAKDGKVFNINVKLNINIPKLNKRGKGALKSFLKSFLNEMLGVNTSS